MTSEPHRIDPRAVALQVERITQSRPFARALRSQRMLRYLVQAALAEPPRPVKEYTLALEVFDRDAGYDPTVAATVRVEAGRMRSRLRDYYQEEGRSDPVLIEVPRGGYAVVVSVREPAAVAVPSAPAQGHAADEHVSPYAARALPDTAPAAAEPQTIAMMSVGKRRRVWWYATSVSIVALLVALVWMVDRPRSYGPVLHSLAVLPLRNVSGDSSQNYYAEGLTDELTTELARVHGLRVVSSSSVSAELKAGKTIEQLAQQLRVDAVLQGSVMRSGNTVRITAQLIDANRDDHVWAGSFEGPAEDILALQDSVTREVAAQTRVAMAPPIAPKPAMRMNPAAYDAYLRGRYFFDRGQYRLSADYFRRAIAIDPQRAPAYAGLADALEAGTTFAIGTLQDTIPEALAAANHAIALDPNSAEAYTAIGSMQTLYGWDWAAAERNLKHGLALDPNYALAETKYAMYLDAVGQPAAAVAHMQRALELEPLSFFNTRRLGTTLYLNRDYDSALVQLKRASELDPDQPASVDMWMSAVYMHRGFRDAAVDNLLIADRATWSEAEVEQLRVLYRQHGWVAFWEGRLNQMRLRPTGQCHAYREGLMLVLLGRRDEAFVQLNRAIDERCFAIDYLQTEPQLDPLRADPRFATLLRRVNLPLP